MVAVAIGEAAAFLVVVSILARLLVSQQRAHARREDLLVNQLLHAVGRDWQEAPAKTAGRDLADDLVRPRFKAAPEQFPVD